MGISLTLIDHHKLPDPALLKNRKVRVVFGYDQENYFEAAAPEVNKQFDYIFSDENPDAMIAATLYLLGRDNKPQYKCLPRGLKERDLTRLDGAGKHNVAFFNCLWAYETDFDCVDEVILVNPHESGLQNISASHIVFAAGGGQNTFMRDLTGVAVVMDYTMDVAFDIIVGIVQSYPDVFPDLAKRIREITLNKYNVYESAFGDITAMFRAPSILYGTKGVDQLVKSITGSPAFTLADLMNDSQEAGVEHLQSCFRKYVEIFEQEMALFEEEKEIRGRIVSYTPHFKSQNFVREIANRIKDRNIDSIIMIRTPTGDGRTKYSIRRGELNVDLGELLEEMQIGGGNPFAAGCTVSDPAAFEKEFFTRIERHPLLAE